MFAGQRCVWTWVCLVHVAGWSASLLGAEEPAPVAVPAPRGEVPASVRAALEQLPKEARPLELRRARNGACYALLPNGAELIVLEKRNAPVVAVQAWVRTGAIHEQEFMGAGLSHFCEHLLFKGTTKRPTGVLDQEIRSAGGDDNAYTSSERTVYHVTCEAAGLATAFDALADMVMDSTFPPEEVQKEHGVVVKEIERSQDNPERALWEAYERMQYQVHPYRIPVLGYPERFQRVTRAEVYAYYKRRYAPQMTAFILVGDFDAAAVLPQMARTLAGWKRTNVEESVIPEEPGQVAPREVAVSHPLCKVPKLILGFPNVSLRHPDLYALDVLASILGDGRSSRLYREVKDARQLVHEIEAFSYTPLYAGMFAASATVDAARIPAAKEAILAVFEAARHKKPSVEELARAKRKVVAQKIFGEMLAEGVAGNLGSDWFVAGDLDFSETYVEGIQRVGAEDVLRVAQKYLEPMKLNYALLLPEKKSGDPVLAAGVRAARPVEQAVEIELQRQRLGGQPDVASVTGKVLSGAPVFEIRMRNGLRVVVREDRALPAVHLALAVLGGQRWESTELAGSANLLAEMLDHGTKKLKKLELAARVEDLGASLATFGGRNTCGLKVRCLKADLPALFELSADCFLNPAFPADELEKVREEVLVQIEEQDEDLFALNSKLLRPLLYGAHPYGRPVLGMKESVRKASAADLARLHAAWFRPEHVALALVGDLTATDGLELVRKAFGAWKSPPASAAPPAPKIEPLAGPKEGELKRPGIESAVLTLGFGGVKLNDPARETLDVIAGLLAGLGGRLSVVIRERLGAAYSVGVTSDAQLDGGAVVFYVQTDEAKLAVCLEAFWAEIKKLREEPVSEKELDSVKNYLAGQEAVSLQSQGDLAQRLALAQLYQEGAEAVFARHVKIRSVTAAQIQEAARKYLDLKCWAKALVRPEPEKAEGKAN